jgi:hypothetical protein
MSFNFSSLWRRAEEACDAGIDALSSIASASSTPLFAAAADAARDALAPLRQPLADGGWPRGHRIEIEGRTYTVERLVSRWRIEMERKGHSIGKKEKKTKGKNSTPSFFVLALSFTTTDSSARAASPASTP